MLNVNNVVKQIKKSTNVFWYKDGQQDYLSNGMWVIRTNFNDELYKSILGELVMKFGFIPEKGEVHHYRREYWEEVDEISKLSVEGSNVSFIVDVFEVEKGVQLVSTNLNHRVIGPSSKWARIYKGKEYIFIDTKYLKMIDWDNFYNIEIYGTESDKPVLFEVEGCSLIILPIRFDKSTLSEFLIKSSE